MSKSSVTTIRPRRGAPPYRLSELAYAYIAALCGVGIVAFIDPALLFFAYPAAGFLITRYYSDRVVWWRFGANVEMVFRAKARFFLLWPVDAPVFMIKVAIAKYL